jgi:hypothetical protein
MLINVFFNIIYFKDKIMSYLNINYSTLEDAWGSNFEKKKKRKQHSSCYLYDKRNLSTTKPYKTINKASTPRAMYPDDDVDYIRYNGYKDKHKLATNMNKLSKYKLKYPYEVQEEHVIQEDVCEEEDTEDEFDITPYSEEVFDEYIPSKHKNVKRGNLVSSEVYKNPYNNINRGYAEYEPSKSVRSRPQRRRKCDKNTLINYSFLSDVHEEDDHTDHIIQWPDKLKKQVDASFVQNIDNQQKPLTHLTPESINRTKKYKINRTGNPSDSNGIEDKHFEYDHNNHNEEIDDDDDDDDDEFGVYLRNNHRFHHEDVEDEYNAILQSVYEENDINKHNKNDKKATKTSKKLVSSTAQEKIYLDFAIYTTSGVLLIFILEQFIQIGMKIKKV